MTSFADSTASTTTTTVSTTSTTTTRSSSSSSSSSPRIMCTGTTHRRRRVEGPLHKITPLSDRLPQTIMQCIFQKLDHVSNRRFSLANRHCYLIGRSRLSSPIHISVQVDPLDRTRNASNNMSKLLDWVGFWKLSPHSLHIYSAEGGGGGTRHDLRPIEKICIEFPNLRHLYLRYTGLIRTHQLATLSRLESLHVVDWAILSPLSPNDFPMLTSLCIDGSAFIRKYESVLDGTLLSADIHPHDSLVYFPPTLTHLHLALLGPNCIDWNLFGTLPNLKKWEIQQTSRLLPMAVFSRLIGIWTHIEHITLDVAAIDTRNDVKSDIDVDLPIRENVSSFVCRTHSTQNLPLRLIRWWNRCPSFRKLDLTECWLQYRDDDAERISTEQFAACRTLTSLSLTDCRVSDHFLDQVLRTCGAPLMKLCIRSDENKKDTWMNQLVRFSKTLTHFDCRTSSHRCPPWSLFHTSHLNRIRNMSQIRKLGICMRNDSMVLEQLSTAFPNLISLDLHRPLVHLHITTLKTDEEDDTDDDDDDDSEMDDLCLNLTRFQSLTRLSVYTADHTPSASSWTKMIHKMPHLRCFSHRMGRNDPDYILPYNVKKIQKIRTLLHPERRNTIIVYGDKRIYDVPEQRVE